MGAVWSEFKESTIPPAESSTWSHHLGQSDQHNHMDDQKNEDKNVCIVKPDRKYSLSRNINLAWIWFENEHGRVRSGSDNMFRGAVNAWTTHLPSCWNMTKYSSQLCCYIHSISACPQFFWFMAFKFSFYSYSVLWGSNQNQVLSLRANGYPN